VVLLYLLSCELNCSTPFSSSTLSLRSAGSTHRSICPLRYLRKASPESAVMLSVTPSR
jgi:hypothetical protein